MDFPLQATDARARLVGRHHIIQDDRRRQRCVVPAEIRWETRRLRASKTSKVRSAVDNLVRPCPDFKRLCILDNVLLRVHSTSKCTTTAVVVLILGVDGPEVDKRVRSDCCLFRVHDYPMSMGAWLALSCYLLQVSVVMLQRYIYDTYSDGFRAFHVFCVGQVTCFVSGRFICNVWSSLFCSLYME